jgi:DNA-binding helix-hairpin-helix protein with protein kinase domain
MSDHDPDKLIPGIDTYPNLGPPEVMPKGYKQIKALPGHQTPAPKIKWGKKFEKMPVEQQIRRAKKVADAMNHAADIAQQRVQELIDIANHQERQLEVCKQSQLDMQRTMSLLTNQHNAEKQARIAEMQELKAELRELKKRLR